MKAQQKNHKKPLFDQFKKHNTRMRQIKYYSKCVKLRCIIIFKDFQ